MTNNTNTYINNIENIKKPTEEIKFIDLPTVKEISEKGLPAEFKKALLDPNARFNSDCEVRCSYEYCPWDTDFRIEIFLEGNRRKWARRPGQATWLPGSWDYGFWTNHYLSRWDLWLRDVGQGSRVIPLLKDDTVYTVNLWGSHCAEDSKFCNEAQQIIRKAIWEHAGGAEVKIRETLSSDISTWSRFAFKVAGSAAMSTVLGPAALPAGTILWGTGQVAREFCETDRGKSFWDTVGSIGQGVIIGEMTGDFLSEIKNDFLRTTIEEAIGNKDLFMASYHIRHRASGENYSSWCEVCN